MQKIADLIRKYNEGKCSDDEKLWLEQWYHSFEWNSKEDAAADSDLESLKEKVWLALLQNKPSYKPQITKSPIDISISVKKWWRYAAAAILILGIGSTTFYLLWSSSKEKSVAKNTEARLVESYEITPGTSKAQLTLGDGSIIPLDSAQNIQIKEKDGTQIDKRSGRLVYNDLAKLTGDEILYNTLSTPRGGEYQLVLPDGTKVWLNAQSSIRFPTRFAGNNRTVFLKGEAYFEVIKNKEMPFQVQLENELTVQALGTSFNIMSYNDEADVKTTLEQGIVKVTNKSNSVLLSPSKQAIVKKMDQKITVSDADVNKALAWKNGMIEFDGDNLPYIMRQLSRWYDIDVLFIGPISKETYKGAIRRQSPILKVLEILKVAGVQYKIEGKKIIISGG